MTFETEIAAFLDELSEVQEELFDVLRAKRQRLASRDPQEIAATHVREELLAERLAACNARRAGLLQSASEAGLAAGSLGDLAATVERKSSGPLGKQVKEAGARMQLLQNESLANWVLAQRSLLHISQLLEIVATGGRLQPTYHKGASVLASGGLVDQEA